MAIGGAVEDAAGLDRADALVWAMTYLMQAMLGGRARIGQL